MTSTNGAKQATNMNDSVDAGEYIAPYTAVLDAGITVRDYPHYQRQGKIPHHRRESYRTVYTASRGHTVLPAGDRAVRTPEKGTH